MKSIRSIVYACLMITAMCVGAGTAEAADKPWIELEARHWDPDFSSKARLIQNNIGRTFDVDSTLGVGDEETMEGVLTFHIGDSHKIRLSSFDVGFDGSQALTETVQFQGKSYTVGTTVNTDLDIQYARLGWIYYFLDVADTVRLGSILEAKFIDFDIALDVPAFPSLNEDESAVGGLPAVGLALEVQPIDELILYAEVSGISDGGTYGHFIEGEAGVKLSYHFLNVSAGYRILDIKAEDDLDFFELELSGAFVGIGVQF